MKWNDFITKHGKTKILAVVKIEIPNKSHPAPSGKVVPTPFMLLKECIGDLFTKDWAIMKDSVQGTRHLANGKKKKFSVPLANILIEDTSDLVKLSKLVQKTGTLTVSSQTPATTGVQFSLESQHYLSMAKAKNYYP